MPCPTHGADCDGNIINGNDELERGNDNPDHLPIRPYRLLEYPPSAKKTQRLAKRPRQLFWAGAAAGPSGGNRGWYVHNRMSQEACKQIKPSP